LHIAGSGDRRQLQDLDRMLEHLNVSGFDHLVISGDLSDRGRTEDWEIVKDKLCQSRLVSLGEDYCCCGKS